jgi:hypothetical protein
MYPRLASNSQFHCPSLWVLRLQLCTSIPGAQVTYHHHVLEIEFPTQETWGIHSNHSNIFLHTIVSPRWPLSLSFQAKNKFSLLFCFIYNKMRNLFPNEVI